MKIIITENALKNLINNIIEEQQDELKELMGVPVGIDQTAINIYDKLVSNFPKGYWENHNNKKQVATTVLDGPFNINDISIEYLDCSFVGYPYDKINKTVIQTIQVRQSFSPEGDKLVFVQNSQMKIDVIFVYNPNTSEPDSIFELIKTDKSRFIRTLAHELKHYYDATKRKVEYPKQTAEYLSYLDHTEILPVDEFLHYMYFVSTTESLVRPTELYTDIQMNNVKKKNFLSFLQQNDVYRKLKDITNWSFENMKQQLHKEIPKIDEILRKLEMNTNISDDQKINEYLELLMTRLHNSNIKHYANSLISPKMMFFDREAVENAQKLVDNYFKTLTQKYSNPEAFFKKSEEYLHYKAANVIRKISKLYAVAKED